MDTPFDEAKKQCAEFAWNFLSMIQMNKTMEKVDMENEEHKLLFEQLIEQHCKHLLNEAIH